MLNQEKLLVEGDTRRRPVRCWGLACACLIGLAAVAGNAQNAKTAGNAQSGDKATPPTIANTAPGATAKVEKLDEKAAQQNGQQNLDRPGSERRKQITDESTQLVALAKDLKTEVDKTSRNMLSVAVIRKAGEIEKLAHNVKDKLKAGGS
jgi:hypothetical protein